MVLFVCCMLFVFVSVFNVCVGVLLHVLFVEFVFVCDCCLFQFNLF